MFLTFSIWLILFEILILFRYIATYWNSDKVKLSVGNISAIHLQRRIQFSLQVSNVKIRKMHVAKQISSYALEARKWLTDLRLRVARKQVSISWIIYFTWSSQREHSAESSPSANIYIYIYIYIYTYIRACILSYTWINYKTSVVHIDAKEYRYKAHRYPTSRVASHESEAFRRTLLRTFKRREGGRREGVNFIRYVHFPSKREFSPDPVARHVRYFRIRRKCRCEVSGRHVIWRHSKKSSESLVCMWKDLQKRIPTQNCINYIFMLRELGKR